MKITNIEGLPEVLVRAIKANWYSGRGEQRFASVTQLIKPTKQVVLEMRHGQEIAQDASEMIWSLMGSAIHRVLEAGEGKESLSEERVSAIVKNARITGGVDLYEDGIITDFKFTSTWAYNSTSRKAEWEKQLNMYAYLYRELGFEVKALQILAIFRDWSKRRAESEASYPRQVEVMPVELWPSFKAKGYIEERVLELKEALMLPDDIIPACSPGERWQTATQYAVFKTGGKRALKVFYDQAEAEAFIKEHKDAQQLGIVTREELPKRCLDFCPVNHYCHYHREMVSSQSQDLDLSLAS